MHDKLISVTILELVSRHTKGLSG